MASSDIELWVAELGQRVRYTTIRVYLSALRSAHVDLGYHDPLAAQPRIERMFRGVKKIQGENDRRLPKLAITATLLRQFDKLLDRNNATHRMLRAAMWVATTCLLRTGEFATDPSTEPYRVLYLRNLLHPPSDDDIAAAAHPQHPQPVHTALRLDASKTDPFRHGVTIPILNVNALAALHEYLSKRQQSQSHPLLPNQPLFAVHNDQPLSRALLQRWVHALASAVGINLAAHNGFSFRRGGATSLAAANVPDHLIQNIGRWASGCYKLYIETSVTQLHAVAQLI